MKAIVIQEADDYTAIIESAYITYPKTDITNL